ncbi:gliding motility-associated C-terminal domain-containing protein [Saprospiraceae bacterium]|nr:gliding motility-associated C-terminal domain-containing protein [Saprospiraceae bacterium]
MDEIPPPPNGGSSCINCLPEGWSSGFPGVELISPGYIQLQTLSTIGECVTFTATGLTTGVPYLFALWWLVDPVTLGGCCAELTITVQGESFHFSTVDQWSLIDICIIPETTELDFEICSSMPPGNSSAHVWLDNAICPEQGICCPLKIEMAEELFVCPNTDLLINPDIIDSEGPVSYIWSSEPSDGVLYLSDTLIEDPIFNYNPAEPGFSGTEYIFELKVIDDNCQAVKEVTVNVLPIEIVDFNFQDFYCTSDGIFIFPSVSIEGYNGTWGVPSINLADYPDQVFQNFFIADEGELDCPFPQSFEINIQAFQTPTFDILPLLCRTEADTYEFPMNSLEGITGTWTIPTINLLNEPNVFITNTFTPNEIYCTEAVIVTVELHPGDPVSFDLPSDFCCADSIFTWPTISNEGVTGTWLLASVDLANISGNDLVNIFTPEESLDGCYTQYQHNSTISAKPVFDAIYPFCKTDPLIFLDIYDSQGNEGTWSIPSFDLDTIVTETIISTWTPLPGQNLCITDTTIVFQILQPTQADFDFQNILCEADPLLVLDVIDLNGISGTWSIPSIDPSVLADQQVQSIFVPNEYEICAIPDTIIFSISELIVPLFELPDYLCSSDSDFSLPLVSSNGVEGIWSIPEIITSENPGSSVQTMFSSTDQSCIDLYTHEIFIVAPFESNVISSNPSSCQLEDGMINIFGMLEGLEFSIDEGNSWQNEPVFQLLAAGIYEILVRSINYPTCIESFESILTSPGSPELIEIEVNQLSSCEDANASISIIAQGNDLEYSIDGGASFQLSQDFLNLAEGNYSIVVRDGNNPDCFAQDLVEVESISETIILDIIRIDVSDCGANDGSVDIIAQGSNLEYSIDDGMTWFDSPIFTNLPAAIYELVVRSTDAFDCSDIATIEISSPNPPEIITFTVIQPTNCNPTSGSIDVIAEGIDLLYSIDNGVTWVPNSLFEDLEVGNYQFIIMEVSFPNCIVSQEQNLGGELDHLDDIAIETILPSDCESEDGSVTVLTNENDVEFSIDNGTTWQLSNIFLNLGPGSFNLIVRKTLLPDCFFELEFVVEKPECPCEDLTVELEIIDIICLEANIGEIIITNVTGMNNPLYSVQWEDGNIGVQNTNLTDGWHTFTILYDEDCVWTDSAYIERFDPLTFALESFDSDCPEAENGSINITEVEGGSGQYSYSVNGNTFQTSGEFYNLSADQYEVLVLDNLGCLNSQFIEIFEEDGLPINLPDIVTIEDGETIFLNPLIDISTIDSFSWSPIANIQNLGDLIAEVKPDQTTSYTLTIYYGECMETRTVTIRVKKSQEIFIANSFSPNNDGLNDYFYIQTAQLSDVKISSFQIYDRWGNLVFNRPFPEPNNAADGWDGSFKNQAAQQGVYSYCIKYSFDDKEHISAGTITIIR